MSRQRFGTSCRLWVQAYAAPGSGLTNDAVKFWVGLWVGEASRQQEFWSWANWRGYRSTGEQHRPLIVPGPARRARAVHAETASATPSTPMSWMARLKRVFDFDISQCPHCGGQLRVVGVVTEPNVIARILAHVRRRERQCHARAPPALLAS